jgi:hypothetical protein
MVLNQDPENAKAYLVKFLAKYRLKTCADIVTEFTTKFSENDNADFQKAIRFADDKMREELRGYITALNDRLYSERVQKYKEMIARTGNEQLDEEPDKENDVSEDNSYRRKLFIWRLTGLCIGMGIAAIMVAVFLTVYMR